MLSWEKRIERAGEVVTTGRWFWKQPQIRGFSDQDRALACDWATCACGQADRQIERIWKDNPKRPDDTNRGCPVDVQLAALGRKFFEAVGSNHVDRAMVLYRKIQERVDELIEAIDSQQQQVQECEMPQSV